MTGSAKQSSFAETKQKLDCFVASLLAMTERCKFAFSRREAPELCMNLSPKKTEGVGNAGCATHPQPRVRMVK
jgi:hypothetical protein